MNTEHTPTPYYLGPDSEVSIQLLGDGPSISTARLVGRVYKKVDADFIVRACNSHDALVAALEELLAATAQAGNLQYTIQGDSAVQQARAALKLAKGVQS